MKRFIIVILLGIISSTQAQKGKQEITLDIADALVMKTIEINYEYYLLNKSSVGLSALFNFAKPSSDLRYNQDRMITPFFRHYFTDTRKWNYFGEIFMGINSGEEEFTEKSIKKIRKYTDGALGIGAGLKYISEGGIVIIANAGVGRNLFTNDAPTLVPRAGLNIGYRF